MKIVSSEPLRVATLRGAVSLFEPGVPKEVAEDIGLLALQAGAKVYDSKAIEIEEAEVVEFEEVSVLDSNAELVTALEKLMDEGDPKNFKQDGYPKAAVVNKLVGRTVNSDEREAAWESILNS
ncbi:MAG: hypothetical protein ACPHZ7_03225 [Vibrio toranzoniae]|jgi:hypothetical protein